MDIIDAHIHLLPSRLVNTQDPYSKALLDQYGRIHKSDGEILDYMPSPSDGGTFSAESLVRLMDRYSVSRSIILQSSFFRITEEIADSIAKYPDRLIGAMVLDPVEESLNEIQKWRRRGLTAVKYEMRGLSQRYPDLRLDSPIMMEIYKNAGALGVTVVMDPGPVGWSCYQPKELEKAVLRNPSTRFVICHMGMMTPETIGTHPGNTLWQEMIALAKYENVWMDISAMPDLFMEEGYPFPTSASSISQFMKQYGNDKPIWGSDAPGTIQNATYGQMKDMYLKCPLFSDTDLEKMFSLNAMAAYM